jgi:hypothetical protein
MVKVKNVNGSSRFESPEGYSTWLDFWEDKCGKTAWICSAIDCHLLGRDNLVGAHVQLVNSTDKSWYIVPLCRKCNTRTDEFFVDEMLVPIRTR